MAQQTQIRTANQTLNTATSFSSQPFEAQHQGRKVLVIATGDVEGQSPSYLVVDEQGESTWVPISEVIVDYKTLSFDISGRMSR